MARERQSKTSFHHGPFKTLKGLSVSKVQKQLPVPPVVTPQTDVPDDADLFSKEMAWLNVRPVAGKVGGHGDEGSSMPSVTALVEHDESAAFLVAVERIDKPFRDELPVEDEPPRARPRRMKQLERGALQPAEELDLHGLTRDEALARTRTFLAHAARQGWPVVLIVTGKGLHSSEGPVLRRAVERLLAEARDLVLEWGEAPRRFGGAGALAVFVRGRQRQG
jgi:DNA-nicking Smr family endonuclease